MAAAEETQLDFNNLEWQFAITPNRIGIRIGAW